MERLTTRLPDGRAYPVKCAEHPNEYQQDGTDLVERLCKYEDAEEQGRMIIYPVSIGDTLYYVPDWMHDRRIDEVKVRGYRLLGGNCQLIEVMETEPKQYLISGYQNISRIGKDLFRTMDEAEARVEELEAENGQTD